MKLFPLSAVTFADGCNESDRETGDFVRFPARRMEADEREGQRMFINEYGAVFVEKGSVLVLVPPTSVRHARIAACMQLKDIAAMDSTVGVAEEIAEALNGIESKVNEVSMDVRAVLKKK